MEQHLLPSQNRILMDFNGICSVLQLIFLAVFVIFLMLFSSLMPLLTGT